MPKAKVIQEDSRFRFRCPGCEGVFREKNPDYSESTIVLFGSHQVSDRWRFNGDFERPTFDPSILVRGGEHETVCHSFVRDGRIEYLNDCTHALAGQSVELPAFESPE